MSKLRHNASFAWFVAGQPLIIFLQANNTGFIESLEPKFCLSAQDQKKFLQGFQNHMFEYLSASLLQWAILYSLSWSPTGSLRAHLVTIEPFTPRRNVVLFHSYT
jgi:hypothetical protein